MNVKTTKESREHQDLLSKSTDPLLPEGAGSGLAFHRLYTREGTNPLDEVEYEKRKSVIANPDGSTVFKMEEVEVPKGWSQLATDIIVSKYFRKAGVPGTGHETSARQVVHRIARTIPRSGLTAGLITNMELKVPGATGIGTPNPEKSGKPPILIPTRNAPPVLFNRSMTI